MDGDIYRRPVRGRLAELVSELRELVVTPREEGRVPYRVAIVIGIRQRGDVHGPLFTSRRILNHPGDQGPGKCVSAARLRPIFDRRSYVRPGNARPPPSSQKKGAGTQISIR